MDRLFQKRKRLSEEEVALLERRLEEALVPVEPSQEFVNDLRRRLLVRDIPVAQKRKIIKSRYAWLIAGGFIGGLFVVLTWIKSFISVASMVGILYYHLQQNNKKKKGLVPG